MLQGKVALNKTSEAISVLIRITTCMWGNSGRNNKKYSKLPHIHVSSTTSYDANEET